MCEEVEQEQASSETKLQALQMQHMQDNQQHDAILGAWESGINAAVNAGTAAQARQQQLV